VKGRETIKDGHKRGKKKTGRKGGKRSWGGEEQQEGVPRGAWRKKILQGKMLICHVN